MVFMANCRMVHDPEMLNNLEKRHVFLSKWLQLQAPVEENVINFGLTLIACAYVTLRIHQFNTYARLIWNARMFLRHPGSESFSSARVHVSL